VQGSSYTTVGLCTPMRTIPCSEYNTARVHMLAMFSLIDRLVRRTLGADKEVKQVSLFLVRPCGTVRDPSLILTQFCALLETVLICRAQETLP